MSRCRRRVRGAARRPGVRRRGVGRHPPDRARPRDVDHRGAARPRRRDRVVVRPVAIDDQHRGHVRRREPGRAQLGRREGADRRSRPGRRRRRSPARSGPPVPAPFASTSSASPATPRLLRQPTPGRSPAAGPARPRTPRRTTNRRRARRTRRTSSPRRGRHRRSCGQVIVVDHDEHVVGRPLDVELEVVRAVAAPRGGSRPSCSPARGPPPRDDRRSAVVRPPGRHQSSIGSSFSRSPRVPDTAPARRRGRCRDPGRSSASSGGRQPPAASSFGWSWVTISVEDRLGIGPAVDDLVERRIRASRSARPRPRSSGWTRCSCSTRCRGTP